ncbi:FAD:protein FMN transferase [Microbispora triticiradicis]|uniref:FAD:protein FMN transferase n=1 Tax=Microbispora triticiradicis TaxID=2200763 RepID=UPI001AD60CAB|nr:FAD:protein FMN transferase [Microbispora triticiradicis]
MRHIEHVMGTVFSFDVRDSDGRHADPGPYVAEAVAWLHHVDEVFSTYKPDSAVSRLSRGEVTLAACPAEVADVLRLCESVALVSHGYFTLHPRGRLDPSGLVKGWAVERASAILRAAGAADHCVNGGGDVRLSGSPAPGRSWRVGVAHPLRPGVLAAVVSGTDLAVATSGTAERGAHVVDPHTGRPAAGPASVTVVGPDLTLADAYATSAFAMGAAARDWVEGLHGYEAFAVTATGATWRTSGFRPRSHSRSHGLTAT